MRIVRIAAFAFTALCLAVAALSLVMPSRSTFSTGSESYSWSCGSAAFPKDRAEYDRMDDILNCTGATPASTALTLIVLAGLGLVAIAVTSWRISKATVPVEPSPSAGSAP